MTSAGRATPFVVLMAVLLSLSLLWPLYALSRSLSLASAAAYSAGDDYYSAFNVTPTGYVTVYLYGVPANLTVKLVWGLEQRPQGPLHYAVPKSVKGTTYYVMSPQAGTNETVMTYNSTAKAYVVSVGPFLNGSLVAYTFNITNSTEASRLVGYEGNSEWRFNVLINPPRGTLGYTRFWLLPNCSLEVTAIARPPDNVTLLLRVTAPLATNWTKVPMSYSPLGANYTALVGPFWNGSAVQWYYYDNSTGTAIYNSNVSPTAPFSAYVEGVSCPTLKNLITVTTTSSTTVTTTSTATATSTVTTTRVLTFTVNETETTTTTLTTTATSYVTMTNTSTSTVTTLTETVIRAAFPWCFYYCLWALIAVAVVAVVAAVVVKATRVRGQAAPGG